ncbi:MAG TPA: long-chain fatty acid--CoA ligase [Candidatus Limnocylindrales bacterium]|nr:long-chain fatty acid--CoA ligase [Candidatus Limnocylindrales bacterium]
MNNLDVYLSKPWLQFYHKDVPPTVEIPHKSISELFDESAAKYANRPAIIFYGNKISYKQLHDEVSRFATALANLGVTKGDKVALYLLNSPQYVIAYLAILRVGGTVTPISPVYTSGEVKHQLADSGARTLICQDILYDNIAKTEYKLDRVILTSISEYLPTIRRIIGRSVLRKAFSEMEVPMPKILASEGFYRMKDLISNTAANPPAVEIDPFVDLASLPYTGGTTAKPKGVMLTHRNIIACEFQIKATWPIIEEGKEVVLAFLPFYHIYGQVVVMLNSILLGSTMVLFTTPDIDDILYAMEKHQASSFFGVPTFFEYLKEYEKTDRVNWKRLKMITCGADTLHTSTLEGWTKRTGSAITEGYGMTETSGVSHVNPLGRSKPGSFGVPLPNITAAIINPDTHEFVPIGETGELILYGPNMMQGYWNRDADNAAIFLEIDGKRWMKTGDLVRMDEEGYFHFYDRAKDLIKFKGYSVFAREIEEVLYKHPQIKAVGVIGVPDPKVGQYIKANVVLNAEARGKISEEDIINYCKENLAHYKVPKIVEFRGELPKTDVGKISRRELREESE